MDLLMLRINPLLWRFIRSLPLIHNSSGDKDRRDSRQPSLPQGHPQDVRHAEQQQWHDLLQTEHACGLLLCRQDTGRVSETQVIVTALTNIKMFVSDWLIRWFSAIYKTLFVVLITCKYFYFQPSSKRRWNCWRWKQHNCKYNSHKYKSRNIVYWWLPFFFALCNFPVCFFFNGSTTTQWECLPNRTPPQFGWAGSHRTIISIARTSASTRCGESPSPWETREGGYMRGKLTFILISGFYRTS